MSFFYGVDHKYVVNSTFSQTTTCKWNEFDKYFEVSFFFYNYKYIFMLLMKLGQFEMTKQAMLYYVHRNILIASFLYII
jgi:hypothetical protein